MSRRSRATSPSRARCASGPIDPDHLHRLVAVEQIHGHPGADAVEVGGPGGDEHGAASETAPAHEVARLDERRTEQRETRAAEECRRPGGAHALTRGRRIDREVAVRGEAQIVDDRQRCACAQPMLQRDLEDVAVEHNDIEFVGVIDCDADTLDAVADRIQRRMPTVDHAGAKCRVPSWEDDVDVDIGAQRIGEGEHPLEMSESDATAAVCGQQRARSHRATARAAAHAWIRRSAMTTSSWSEEVIAG